FQFHSVDQRRIVRISLRAIDPLRYWPALQIIIRYWLQILRSRLPAEPRRELILREKHWHSVVAFGSEVGWLGDDHRAPLQPLASLAVLPFVPKTGCGKER